MVLDKKVGDLAQKRANQAMRREILPLLTLQHPRPNSWNPLRQAKGDGYVLKLRLPDPLVKEILGNQAILQRVADIAVNAVQDAALEEPKAFVTAIFDALFSE